MHLKPTMSVLPLLFLLGGVSAQCIAGNDNPPTMNPSAKKAIIGARFGFALESLKKASLIETRDNIFYSPHSLYEALTLAYFGARGTTEASLSKALHIPSDLSKVDLQRYYALENAIREEADAQANSSANYEYRSVNRMWISDTRKVRECMLNLFGNQLEKTDFRTNPSAVRDRINNWVSNVTKGHIRDLLPSGSIDEGTDLVLGNAVFFKGLWESRFNPLNSKKDLFYSSGSQNSLTMFMTQKGNFQHTVSEELGAHVLRLPYTGGDISMYILLPPFATARSVDGAAAASGDRDGVRQLIERISTENGSALLRELLDYELLAPEVSVTIPRFEIEKELPLPTLLHALGAGDLVTIDAADLRGFLEEGEQPLHLGDAIHRARIEVTEEGTTASAATALLSFRSSRPSEPAVFKANHPFVYFIYDNPKHRVLFAGIYRTPNSAQNTAESSA